MRSNRLRPLLGRALRVISAVLFVGWAQPAAAQPAGGQPAGGQPALPTAAAKAEAQRLYVQAKALRDRGDAAAALALFRRSHELAPTPVTRLELARMLEALGRLIEAHQLADSVATLPVTPTETAKGRMSREEAAALASDLGARIPRVTLAVTPPSPDVEVRLDGVLVSKELLGGEQDVDPGEHVVVARVGERAVERRFTARERERAVVELPIPDPPAPPAVAPPPVVVTPPAPRPTPRPVADDGLSPVVPVSFTIAGVALATGLVTGGVALAQAGELKDACVLEDDRCPREQHDLLETHQAVATTSTIAFALAGAATAVGVVVLVVDGADDDERPAATMRLRWAGTGIAAEGTWN